MVSVGVGCIQVAAEEVWLPDASYRAGRDWPVAGPGDEEDSPGFRRPLQAGPSPAQGPEGQSHDPLPAVFFCRLLPSSDYLLSFRLHFIILSCYSPLCLFFLIFFSFTSTLSPHLFYWSFFLFYLVHIATTFYRLPFFTVILICILKVAPTNLNW